MTELDKLTALMSDTDALARRVVRARVDGLLPEHHAAIMLSKLAVVAAGFQSMLTEARDRAPQPTPEPSESTPKPDAPRSESTPKPDAPRSESTPRPSATAEPSAPGLPKTGV